MLERQGFRHHLARRLAGMGDTGHGIINEVYWPSTGEPQIRDFSFYLLGKSRWIDLKRLQQYEVATPGPCLPLPTVVHSGEDYRLTLEILPESRRDVVLVRFKIQGPYRLAVILAPHLGSTGRDNSAWVSRNSAYAQRGDSAICLSADVPLQASELRLCRLLRWLAGSAAAMES